MMTRSELYDVIDYHQYEELIKLLLKLQSPFLIDPVLNIRFWHKAG